MTAPLTGTTAAAGLPVSTPSRTDLGRDQFLKLLVTQLRHQDPLSPLQADAFAAQLAQFTAVEQLTKLNQAFEGQRQDSVLGNLLDKTALGAALIGKRVVAEGNQLAVGSSGSPQIRIEVGGSGGKGTLTVLSVTGQVVATQALGNLPGGLQTVRPPNLPPGSYTYAVDVRDPAGNPVRVRTFTEGTVDGVLFESGAVFLRIGGMKVPLDQLSEITP